MKLKSIGLVISDGDLYFKSTYEGDLTPKQMDNLVTKFTAVFSRLSFKATILLPKDSKKALYVIKKKLRTAEIIPEDTAYDYIDMLRECNKKVKDVVETITKIEEEVQRFELIKEVADVSIQS